MKPLPIHRWQRVLPLVLVDAALAATVSFPATWLLTVLDGLVFGSLVAGAAIELNAAPSMRRNAMRSLCLSATASTPAKPLLTISTRITTSVLSTAEKSQ